MIYPRDKTGEAWAQCPKCEPAGSVKRLRLTIYPDGTSVCRNCGPIEVCP